MNIGIFTDTYYPEISGVATSTMQLKKEMERLGHVVYVFTVSNPKVKEKEENVFRMASVPFIFFSERRISVEPLTKWYKIIESLELDIIHTQTEFTVAQLGMRAARKLNIPVLHTYHTLYEEYTHYLKFPGNTKLKTVIRGLSRKYCNHVDEVIVPTEKIHCLLREYGVTKPIAVQPTGIDLRKFGLISQKKISEIKSNYNIDKDNHVLLSVGRLSKEKNIEELLCYLERLIQKDSNVRMFFVGDGPEKERMEERVNKCDLGNNIFFTGAIRWRDIQNYYAMANVYVSNSISETQGLTYQEALAAGKPLLVRKDDCQSSFMDIGVNGYTFENYEEFEQYYCKLFAERNHLKMEAMARNSVTECTAEAFGARIEELYYEAIRKNSPVVKGEDVYGKIQSVAG